MDESLFVKINGSKNWIIGVPNNKTGNIRVYIFNTRAENYMRLFINNHIIKATILLQIDGLHIAF